MEDNKNEDKNEKNNLEDVITSDMDTETLNVVSNIKIVKKEDSEEEKSSQEESSGTKTSRIGGKRAKSHAKHGENKAKKKKLTKEEKRERRYYINKKGKKKLKKRYKFLIAFLVLLLILILIFAKYMVKSGGSVKDAVLNIATDIVGEQDPIFVLILGVSEDIKTPLTDTIILCGYNPKTQKAYMLSIPRDTYVGKNPASANGFDKINAKFQTSAERTVETVELITGVKIDYYAIVRNLKIEDIFECIGSVDFDVPINMDYDDPTQDLHIHLKKGYQTLQPNQIEQLLRFRHNNNGTSYPSSYGDNDYGRMKTQRAFIKAVIDQKISLQNVGKVKDLVSYAYTNIQTNMSGTKVLDYVPYGLQFSTSNLRSEQLPGQSAMINGLWFYQHSKSKTKKLVDELMIYLELDEEILLSHYDYGKELVGVKPTDDWKSETVIEDYVIPNAVIRDTSVEVDQETCKHNYGILSEKVATCTDGGTVVKRCALCDKEIVESTPALGHNYDSNGVCTRCGEKKKDSTNTVNNNTITNTVTNTTNTTINTNTVIENTVKPEETKPEETHTEHTWVEAGSTEANCTSAAIKSYKCSVCGKTKTETVGSALGHNYVNGVCTRCQAPDPDYKPVESNPSTDPNLEPKSETPPITNTEPVEQVSGT